VVTDDWLLEFQRRRNDALAASLKPIDGAVAAVHEINMRLDGMIACASGADLGKVELQLRKVGLDRVFAGKMFSGMDQPRSKPAPDVYLAAAAFLGIDPARAAVVEDTVPGVTAGVAAGATVFGFWTPAPPTSSRRWRSFRPWWAVRSARRVEGLGDRGAGCCPRSRSDARK
jgi:HAD superfamily hydrolase (TIGR01509 family)